MFKKVRMARESDEWVLELAGHEVPVVMIKAEVTALFVVILVYWAYLLGTSDALARECNKKLYEANQKIITCSKSGGPLNLTPMDVSDFNTLPPP